MTNTQLSQLAFVIGMAIIAPFVIRFLAGINHAYMNWKLAKRKR